MTKPRPYVHSPNCSGCPQCDLACARVMTMSPAELGQYYEARTRAAGAGGPNRVLRVASAGTMRTTGAAPACGCGGAAAAEPGKDRVAKLAALKRTTLGRRIPEATLRTLSEEQLVDAIAEAVVFDRELTHPVCTYGLDGRRPQPATGQRAAVAVDGLPVNYNPARPPDPYDLAGLERQRLAALRGEVAA